MVLLAIPFQAVHSLPVNMFNSRIVAPCLSGDVLSVQKSRSSRCAHLLRIPVAVFTMTALLSMASASAEEYYISRLPARLVPRQAVFLNMPQNGEVEIVQYEERARKGDLLVRINPREAEMEEEEFSLEMQRDELKQKEDLLQLQRQKEELSFVTGLPPDQRIYVRDKIRAKADARAIELLDEKIALLRAAAAAEKGKKETLHAQKAAQAEVRMPFDGLVQFYIRPPEDGSSYVPVPGGAALVSLADDSELYVAVSIPSSEWVNLPTEHLLLKVEDTGEDSLTAHWHHSGIEKSEQMEGLVYYFAIDSAQKLRAMKLLGTRIVGRLFLEGDNILYLRKDEAARAAGNEVFETWAELVDKVYPGYCILFCGETHLALAAKNAS